MTESTDGASPWLFLFGLVLFLGTAVLFVIDLVRGGDVFRAILGNAVGAVVLIGWAALDTVRDPESTVTSVGGATGTALLLYALYLAGTGAIIAATALLGHDYFTVGLLYAVLAAVAAGLGYSIFPTGTVADSEESETEGPASE
ncbi:hypothetical protein [Halovenus salina]|uniref:hypothetical protein n=1 Tax=Halovenus salina TaxID=1510225 RepID=UPI002260818A|nr:hypothetical protein [Halovenus salina]